MWIEWPAGLLNLSNITCIKLLQSDFDQWMIKAYANSEDYYVRYFECKATAEKEYNAIRENLLCSGAKE